ncbi:MAG: VirB3 family type IV secretion system protein [Sphingobium sp.]
MNESESRRMTPFHRALHRPQQVMGGERELMLFSMLVAGGLIVSAMNLVATVVGLVNRLFRMHKSRNGLPVGSWSATASAMISSEMPCFAGTLQIV